ncbi:MAG TPA: hypothetical protein DEF51_24785 [Myxococcales bacterium]|nr:hypothetical protein [Myxococcales bacterium]
MRIHLQVVDADGRAIHESTIESTLISIGPEAPAMFHHPEVPWLEVRHDGRQAALHAGPRVIPLKRSNVIPLSDGRHSLHVELYLRPDAVPRVRGACPSCGEPLIDHQIGGAYRSVARKERRCASCETAVVGLRDAPDVFGRFSDRTTDWLHVSVSSRCPDCLGTMSRAVFSGERHEVEVERCGPCGLVVLDAADQARLAAP